MVGLLFDPKRGATVFVSGLVSRRVASWRKKVESSRSEFFRVPSGFLSEISAVMMMCSQGCLHTRMVPYLYIFNHTPPAPILVLS